jgi:hypothetical protein
VHTKWAKYSREGDTLTEFFLERGLLVPTPVDGAEIATKVIQKKKAIEHQVVIMKSEKKRKIGICVKGKRSCL